jgi:predicted XRE-type DNA-binding protein
MHRNLSPEASAEALGFSQDEEQRWRAQIVALQRLKDVIQRENLTHAEVARRAGTSRSRVTAILNENLEQVSPAALEKIAERIEAA